MDAPTHRRGAGQRYADAMASVARRLPFGLGRVVAPTVLGFALINAITFTLDLSLLTVLHGHLRLALPLAITAAYGTALALAFALNRALNFRSHAPVGPQFGCTSRSWRRTTWSACSASAPGWRPPGWTTASRASLAGVCEAVFLYLALRQLVFAAPRIADATPPR